MFPRPTWEPQSQERYLSNGSQSYVHTPLTAINVNFLIEACIRKVHIFTYIRINLSSIESQINLKQQMYEFGPQDYFGTYAILLFIGTQNNSGKLILNIFKLLRLSRPKQKYYTINYGFLPLFIYFPGSVDLTKCKCSMYLLFAL